MHAVPLYCEFILVSCTDNSVICSGQEDVHGRDVPDMPVYQMNVVRLKPLSRHSKCPSYEFLDKEERRRDEEALLKVCWVRATNTPRDVAQAEIC